MTEKELANKQKEINRKRAKLGEKIRAYQEEYNDLTRQIDEICDRRREILSADRAVFHTPKQIVEMITN